jgi:cell wall-associated NlpC family hydrolase
MQLQYEEFLGRPWTEIGSNDCFRLVMDLYDLNFKIQLTNYARPKDWDSDKLDIIGKLYEREGFYKVTDWSLKTLQPGDVLCIAISSRNPNHLAVYVGENLILHQLLFRMSNVEVLRDFWRNSICYVLRHPNVPCLEEKLPTVDLMELANARYKVKAEKETSKERQDRAVRSDS